MSEMRPTQIGPVPVDENGIDLLDKALELSNAESRRWAEQHAALVDRSDEHVQRGFQTLEAPGDGVVAVSVASAAVRKLRERYASDDSPSVSEASAVEEQFVEGLLRAAGPEGLTVEVIHTYVNARVRGDGPAEAAAFARREWDL